MSGSDPSIGTVPVTIIGGYLGAGKTTLLNHVLQADHGRRLAVLVNDFGSIDIDNELIVARDGETISLTNGCICCTVADALGDALDRVLKGRPDQILIEASGVADPANVAAYGLGWPGCRLDGVVVVVDAETVRSRFGDEFVGDLVAAQLDAADLILLTKGDLVDTETLDGVAVWLRSRRVGREVPAPVVAAERGRADPAIVLDIGADDLDRLRDRPLSELVADDLFVTAAVEPAGPLSRSALTKAMAQLPEGVVRLKGLVEVDDADSWSVIHGVGRRGTIETAYPTQQPTSRIVAIALSAAQTTEGPTREGRTPAGWSTEDLSGWLATFGKTM